MDTLRLLFANTAVTIAGVATAAANQLATRIGLYLIAFCMCVDIFRYFLPRLPNAVSLISTISNDFAATVVAAASILVLIVLWVKFPMMCPEHLNEYISDNFHFAKSRLQPLGPICSVPHGSVLLIAQAASPLVALLVIIMNSIYSRANFAAFSSSFLLRKSPRSPSDVRVAIMICAIPVFFFLSNIIIFEFDPVGFQRNRPFRPQDSLLSYLVLLIVYYVPVLAMREALYQSRKRSNLWPET